MTGRVILTSGLPAGVREMSFTCSSPVGVSVPRPIPVAPEKKRELSRVLEFSHLAM